MKKFRQATFVSTLGLTLLLGVVFVHTIAASPTITRDNYKSQLGLLLKRLDSASDAWRKEHLQLIEDAARRCSQSTAEGFTPTEEDLVWLRAAADKVGDLNDVPAAKARPRRAAKRSPASAPSAPTAPAPSAPAPSAPSPEDFSPPTTMLRPRDATLPLSDVFRAPLNSLQSAQLGFGRYAYLVSSRMPNPNDPRDYAALAIKALLERMVVQAGDLEGAELANYGITYIPVTGDVAADADWKHFASSYALGMANRIRTTACRPGCQGDGPWLVVTEKPIGSQPVSADCVLNLATASSPAMIEKWVQHFKGLMQTRRDWANENGPGSFAMRMRNRLAQVGDLALNVVGVVISVQRVFAVDQSHTE